MKRLFTLLFVLLFSVASLFADEGMWLPNLIGSQVKDMKSKGFKLSADDIYNINKASLKDAIVLFGRGCTGELISAEGLMLTNHHCGYGQIQQHSSLANDYLTNGFWAMDRSQELPNPGLIVSFLVRMEDVTDRALAGVADDADTAARDAKIAENITAIKEQAGEDGRYSTSVEWLYYGNQAFLFVYEIYRDVRLVGAPPSSIGKFGGDTDNWIWPRHTGDFSVFRIYADKDNKPADYSPDNVPYKPKKHFTISTKGVQEGDFTFVYGFPGTTREYVVSDFVDYTLNHSNPAKINLRTMRLDVMKAAQETDPQVRIMYASKVASVANAWKKWQGESLGLARLGTVDKKRDYEKRLYAWAADKPAYRNALDELHSSYDELFPYAMARDYYIEAFSAIELINVANRVSAGTQTPEWVEEFYKNYSPEIDRKIAVMLLNEYVANVPERFVPEFLTESVAEFGGLEGYVDMLFGNSMFVTKESFEEAGRDDNFKQLLESDDAVVLLRAFQDMYKAEIAPSYDELNARITGLYKTYMRAQMEFEPQRNFYPDANLTLRVAYGKVEGYRAADAVQHKFGTTIEGIMQKDNPDIYDYDIPQRLRDVYSAKDYGRWGVNVGTKKQPQWTVPVAFIASNHTTGGNSGSPLLNGRGELVGINFDRTWLSTMSDLEFDPEICRNISVDIRYVLFVIDKIGGAGYLIEEMTIK